MQGETEIAAALAWLEPLRVYPRWLVLVCVAIVAGLYAIAHYRKSLNKL